MTLGIIVNENGRWVVRVGNIRIDVDASMKSIIDDAIIESDRAYAEAHPPIDMTEVAAKLERYQQIIAITAPDRHHGPRSPTTDCLRRQLWGY